METTTDARWDSYPVMPGEPAAPPQLSFVKTLVGDPGGHEDILTLRKSADGRLFFDFMCASSQDDTWQERRLWYEVSAMQMEGFENRDLSNLDLVLGSMEIYLVEFDYDNKTQRAHRVNRFDVAEYHSHPSSYKPLTANERRALP